MNYLKFTKTGFIFVDESKNIEINKTFDEVMNMTQEDLKGTGFVLDPYLKDLAKIAKEKLTDPNSNLKTNEKGEVVIQWKKEDEDALKENFGFSMRDEILRSAQYFFV